MLRLKTKWFHKWSEKNSISNKNLLKAIENISKNYGIVNLGEGLYKVRVARSGQGKRGSFRTIIVYKELDRAIFVYGFSKNERDNPDRDELKYFRKLAKDLLIIEKSEYLKMIKSGDFIIIEE